MNTAELLNHIEDRALELAEARRDLAAMTDRAEALELDMAASATQRASISKENISMRSKVARLADQLAAAVFDHEGHRKDAEDAANHQTGIILTKNEEIERLSTELALARQEVASLLAEKGERVIDGYRVNPDGYVVHIPDENSDSSLRYLTEDKTHGMLFGEWSEYGFGVIGLVEPKHYRPATDAEVEAAGRHPSDPKFKA